MPDINSIKVFLESKPPEFFQFKRIRGRVTGYYKGDHIELDYTKDLIPTIIHECIHALEPKWSESRVIQEEKKIIKTLTPIQAAEVLLILAKKIVRTERLELYFNR
jgi:HEPN domain-containing protein